MSEPLVSVCLITYNHAKYIRQAIESIVSQKVNFPWEIIIADDCSPDNTRSIILEYHRQYPDLVKLLFQEKNVGGGKNFVDLISAAKGKYIAYLEGDDFWTDENKLQTQFDFLEANPDVSLCYHKIKWVHTYTTEHNPDLESNTADPSFSTLEDILEKGWFIRSCTMFYRNFPLPKGFENLYVGDYPLHVLLADKGKIGFINKCMAVYRINDMGYSEQNLIDNDIVKKRKIMNAELEMYEYLNEQTYNKYKKQIAQKKFDTIYSYILFINSNNKGKGMNELLTVIKQNGFLFIIRQLILKIKSRIVA